MYWVGKLKDSLERLKPKGAERIAPTASLRKVYPAGQWYEQESPARLASLCRAAANALRKQPVFCSSFDGRKRFDLDGPAALQVGIGGGERWLELIDADSQGQTLADKIQYCAETRGPRGSGLELLDLSEQGTDQWRGTLLIPRIARLVLLRTDRGSNMLPLVLDYSVQAADGTQAAQFLDDVAAAIS